MLFVTALLIAASSPDQQVIDKFLKSAKPEVAKRYASLRGVPTAAQLTDRSLLPLEAVEGEMATNITRYGERRNQVAIYTALYDAMSAQWRKDLKLLTPRDANASLLTATDLFAINSRIALSYARPVEVGSVFVYEKAQNPTHSCSAELQSGSGGDRSGADCSAQPYDPRGIVARTDWANKSALTCVKNQAARGTCHAFTTASMFELNTARQEGVLVNFSEQAITFATLYGWDTSLAHEGDWAHLPPVINGLLAIGQVPYEQSWAYNPSFSRRPGPNAPTVSYADSCTGYSSSYCSDTPHQGRLESTNPLAYGAPPLAMRWVPTGTYEMEVMDPAGPSTGPAVLAQLRMLVASGTPVGLGFTVSREDFYRARSDGYVPYNGRPSAPGSTSPGGLDSLTPGPVPNLMGGHAVHLVASIPNDYLPADAPPGLGGGYFVAKNSWGTCRGDKGYFYMPWQHVIDYGFIAVGLGISRTSFVP